MQLTKEILLKDREAVENNFNEHIAQANAAKGVLSYIDQLISYLDKEEKPLSLDELKEVLGADSIEHVEKCASS